MAEQLRDAAAVIDPGSRMAVLPVQDRVLADSESLGEVRLGEAER
jgi:hypothetical protein